MSLLDHKSIFSLLLMCFQMVGCKTSGKGDDNDVCSVIETVGSDDDEVIELDPDKKYVDKKRFFKDLGSDLIVQDFFNSQSSMYSFMEKVYGDLERRLDEYRKANSIPKNNIVLLFKGGNVLRSIFFRYLRLIPYPASDLIRDEYEKYFTRSDSDFSVYVDYGKIGKDPAKLNDDISEVMYDELKKITSDFEKDPEKYFSFFQLKKSVAILKLKEMQNKLNQEGVFSEAVSPMYYDKEYTDVRLLDLKSNDTWDCGYHNKSNYLASKDGDQKALISKEGRRSNSFIVNSKNSLLDIPLTKDLMISFSLARSKVVFNYTFKDKKLNKYYRSKIGGELIDISIPKNQDYSLGNYFKDQNYSEDTYQLTFRKKRKSIAVKAYSLAYLAHDLEGILFRSFKRPWLGGGKYQKRLYRVFLLYLIDMSATLRSNAERLDAIEAVKGIVEQLQSDSGSISLSRVPSNLMIKHFLDETLELRKKINKDSEAKDWVKFLAFIQDNLDELKNALVSSDKDIGIDKSKLTTIDMDDLFVSGFYLN